MPGMKRPLLRSALLIGAVVCMSQSTANAHGGKRVVYGTYYAAPQSFGYAAPQTFGGSPVVMATGHHKALLGYAAPTYGVAAPFGATYGSFGSYGVNYGATYGTPTAFGNSVYYGGSPAVLGMGQIGGATFGTGTTTPANAEAQLQAILGGATPMLGGTGTLLVGGNADVGSTKLGALKDVLRKLFDSLVRENGSGGSLLPSLIQRAVQLFPELAPWATAGGLVESVVKNLVSDWSSNNPNRPQVSPSGTTTPATPGSVIMVPVQVPRIEVQFYVDGKPISSAPSTNNSATSPSTNQEPTPNTNPNGRFPEPEREND